MTLLPVLRNDVTTHKQVPKVPPLSWFYKITRISWSISYLRPDGEVEEPVPAVKVERPVEIDHRLVAVLALQRELARLVARQDGVRDLAVDRVGLVRVVRRDPAEDRQTCNILKEIV